MESIKPAIWFPAVRAGSGADIFTIRLAEALEKKGIRSEISWLPHRAEYAPWSISPSAKPSWANIIHTSSWLSPRFISSTSPLVVTLHSCVHDPLLQPYKTVWQRLYHEYLIKPRELTLLEKADAITAVSNYTGKQASNIFGCKKIIPIHNWINTDDFHPDNRQKPNSPFRLLFVGNPGRRKGTDLFPRIMQQLGEDYELRYTGTPSEFSQGRPLPPNMIPLGHISGTEALARTYRECDALLFPTRLEGLSLVTLEALACGRPIIASDCSSMPEVVRNGDNGYLCPKDDVEAFVSAIRRLHDNTDVWQRMCLRARYKATNDFTEKAAVEQYMRIYNSLIGKGWED